MQSLTHLLKRGDYTTAELEAIFNISRATVYRHLHELRQFKELKARLDELDDADVNAYLDDLDDED
jgi:Fic family protein